MEELIVAVVGRVDVLRAVDLDGLALQFVRCSVVDLLEGVDGIGLGDILCELEVVAIVSLDAFGEFL